MSTSISAQNTTHTLAVVIFTTSALSVIGAAGVMLSFVLFPSLRAFRHQLIFGLALSDLFMAASFLVSSGRIIAGYDIGAPSEHALCEGTGFVAQMFVVQTDYWILMIATTTFFVLGQFHNVTHSIEKYRNYLFAAPWILSITNASLSVGLHGFGSIGAWCGFTDDRMRLLVNFVPRWIIVAIILVMYTKLYLIIRAAHKSSISIDKVTLDGSGGSGNMSPLATVHEFSTFDKSFKEATCAVTVMDARKESLISTAGRRVSAALRPEMARRKSSTRPNAPRYTEISRQMIIYPALFVIIWTIPTAARIYQTVTGHAVPFNVGVIDKLCVAIQGLADSLAYGYSETTRNLWRTRFRSRNPRSNSSV